MQTELAKWVQSHLGKEALAAPKLGEAFQVAHNTLAALANMMIGPGVDVTKWTDHDRQMYRIVSGYFEWLEKARGG